MGCIHSILKRISKIKWMTHKISQGQKYSIGFQPRVEYNLLVNDINSLNQGHPFFLKKKKKLFFGLVFKFCSWNHWVGSSDWWDARDQSSWALVLLPPIFSRLGIYCFIVLFLNVTAQSLQLPKQCNHVLLDLQRSAEDKPRVRFVVCIHALRFWVWEETDGPSYCRKFCVWMLSLMVGHCTTEACSQEALA